MFIDLFSKFLEILVICLFFIPMVYFSNILGTVIFKKKRNRGFEKVSPQQWAKDILKRSELTDENGYNFGINSYNKIKMPKRATSHSAGYDVFTPFGFTLKPDDFIVIPMGWKAYMNRNEKLVLHPRSGHGFKYFIRLANTTGIGDSDYYNCENNEGHYFVKIRNEGSEDFTLNSGDAVAQCIFEEYKLADGDSFSGQKRIGGFGSTGK